jgi:hypothetical protein
LEGELIGRLGVDPEVALWMTPREIQMAIKGHNRSVRERVAMHPMSGLDSAREVRKFIEGGAASMSPEEQQQKLDELKDRIS